MTKQALLFLWIFIVPLIIFGQDSLKTLYPGGPVKDVRILKNGKLIQGFHYLPNSELAFKFDCQRKQMDSYVPLEEIHLANEDTLEYIFYQICPSYTFAEHSYVNNKNAVTSITNYQGKYRNGDYEVYSESGKIIQKGQFRNDEKVGIWTYYDENGKSETIYFISGNYMNKDGLAISITFTLLPIIFAVIFILATGFIMIKRFSYTKFYITVSVFNIILILVLFSSSPTSSFSNYVRPILWTFWFAMTVLSIGNLFIPQVQKSKVIFVLSFVLAILGVGLGLLVIALSGIPSGGMIG